MVLHEGSQSAICMAKNPQFHDRTKNFDIKYYFIREQVSSEKLEPKYCRTNHIIADMTKGLSDEQFEKLKLTAGVVPMTEHSKLSEEC